MSISLSAVSQAARWRVCGDSDSMRMTITVVLRLHADRVEKAWRRLDYGVSGWHGDSMETVCGDGVKSDSAWRLQWHDSMRRHGGMR